MEQHLAVYRPFCRKLGTIARVCSDIYVGAAMFCANITHCIKYLTLYFYISRYIKIYCTLRKIFNSIHVDIAHFVKYLTVYKNILRYTRKYRFIHERSGVFLAFSLPVFVNVVVCVKYMARNGLSYALGENRKRLVIWL